MTTFEPQPAPAPSEFDSSYFSQESQEIARRSRQTADKLGYWYNATHHLFYALLEYNFTTHKSLLNGIDLPIYEFKMAMLRVDPPMTSATHFYLPLQTTQPTWNCYTHAISVARNESRVVTPVDVFEGLLRFRESPVDTILAERGIRICSAFTIESTATKNL